MLDVQQIRALYSKRAARYDLSANLYYLIGVRVNAYRRKAVGELNLQRGDTVLELGCGTGLNFPFLQEAVGAEGKIIGVDLTPAMLAQARARVRAHGWRNVQLIQANASQLAFPEEVDGIFSSFALSIMPDDREIIREGAEALTNGGRLAILDLKLADGWMSFLNPIGLLITKPFAGTYEAGRRRPWEEMRKHLSNVQLKEYYFGFVYIASGTRARELSDTNVERGIG
jgi:ubiquinone/menaquinone biosynthesis C-methylase UbiE